MRVVFAGTPEFAKKILQRIISQNNVDICFVLTQPDRQSGRGQKVNFSEVKSLALENNIEVLQPLSLRDPNSPTVKKLETIKPDLMIVAAYGLILPQNVLDIPKYGCINAHASILPKWRGASPIQHSILEGDKKTGITVMQMEKGLDSGPMLKIKEVNIESIDTSSTLHEKLADIAAEITCEVINEIKEKGEIRGEIQDHNLATYAHKISKTDAKINWQQDAYQIERSIRAYNPWPIAYTTIADKVVRVFSATVEEIDEGENYTPGEIISISKNGILVATKDKAVEIKVLQLPGKKSVKASDFYNAMPKGFNEGICCE